jgi:AraC family transcriptional regulator
MALRSRLLASGPGWQVHDVICDSGPHDRPFEEQHTDVRIAAVMAGTFRYRTSQGEAVLTPGAVLLGNKEDYFECGHDHSRGDRCLSFGFSPEFLDEMALGVPGGPPPTFAVPRLPPLPSLVPLLAAAEVARDKETVGELEELAIRISSEVLTLQHSARANREPTSKDMRRVADVIHWIEGHARHPLTLKDLARMACMSRYHFVRIFSAVVGVTPYQYILSRRFNRACLGLRNSSSTIASVAVDAGFADLSTFNRQFLRLTNSTPKAYRRVSLDPCGRNFEPAGMRDLIEPHGNGTA